MFDRGYRLLQLYIAFPFCVAWLADQVFVSFAGLHAPSSSLVILLIINLIDLRPAMRAGCAREFEPVQQPLIGEASEQHGKGIEGIAQQFQLALAQSQNRSLKSKLEECREKERLAADLAREQERAMIEWEQAQPDTLKDFGVPGSRSS